MPASTTDRPRPRPLALAAALGLAPLLLAVGCTSDPPDPAEVRRDQVRTRLEASFSDAQTDCIVGALDDGTVEALVGTGDLDPTSDAFTQYSNVVLLCSRDRVADDEATTTTETAPSTTAAAATSTTGG